LDEDERLLLEEDNQLEQLQEQLDELQEQLLHDDSELELDEREFELHELKLFEQLLEQLLELPHVVSVSVKNESHAPVVGVTPFPVTYAVSLEPL
jgi:hypothetical protein